MEIPLNAPVECTDGVWGRSEYVLINPAIDQVTHLIFREEEFPKFLKLTKLQIDLCQPSRYTGVDVIVWIDQVAHSEARNVARL